MINSEECEGWILMNECKMLKNEIWRMNDEGWILKDEWWMMEDETNQVYLVLLKLRKVLF